MTLSTSVINLLNKMNKAAQKAGLGTILSPSNAEVKAETVDKAVMVSNLRKGAPVVSGTLEHMFLQHYQIAPAVAASDAIHAAITLTTATQTITGDITNPDFPRLVCIVSNAAITTKVTISGTDIAGNVVSEELTLNGTTPVNSTIAFKTVTSIACPVRTNAGDTVTVGTVNTFGLPHVVPYAACLLVKLFNGSTDSGSLTVNATLAKNVFALNGTPDGSKKVDLYYMC